MKTLLLVSSLILSATSAYSSPRQAHLVCSNMAADYGYRVTFSADGLSAEVEENNIAGAVKVADLICPAVEPAPGYDQITTTTCVEDSNGSDSAYSVLLQTGGIAGLSRVKLRQGRLTIAEMHCIYEMGAR